MNNKTIDAPRRTSAGFRASCLAVAVTAMLALLQSGCGSSTGAAPAGASGSSQGAPVSAPPASAPSGPGTAHLAWTAPAFNTDGSPIGSLAGYKVYYGTSSGIYTNSITVGNTTSYQVADLPTGVEVYFAVTVYTTNGDESLFSNEVSKYVI